VTVPVNTLMAWMEARQHKYLDILKIDIEGAEYDVLEALIEADHLPFTQLLVEYHKRFLSETSKHRHDEVLQKLERAGFTQLWSQNQGQEVGYIKVADLAYCEQPKGAQRHVSGRGPIHANVVSPSSSQRTRKLSIVELDINATNTGWYPPLVSISQLTATKLPHKMPIPLPSPWW
jgi:hypothetical protein